MKEIFDILKQLTAVIGPSGNEAARANVIRKLVSPYADDIHTDAIGNLIVHKKGNGPKVMVAAHMDTLGFIVERIDANGFIKVFCVGGVRSYALTGHRVRFENGAVGTFQTEQRADVMKKDLRGVDIDAFYVDIGARSREEAMKYVSLYERGVYAPETIVVNGHVALSPYCDDLMGCAIMISCLTRMGDTQPANDMYFVFTVQEEVGCRGAQLAAERIQPDLGIVIEASDAENVFTKSDEEPRILMGGGAVLREYDGRTVYDHALFNELRGIAKEAGHTCQIKCNASGSNDSSSIQRAHLGVKVACLSIPTRYMHSQAEMQDLSDAAAVRDILGAVAHTTLKSGCEQGE